MEIEIRRIITNEYQYDGFKLFDLNHLEAFLNKEFCDKSYGESVVKYIFGFELYKFDGKFADFFKDDIQSWQFKNKFFVTNSHIDWNAVINLNENEVYEIIKTKFVDSVSRIGDMKRKPKNFHHTLFKEDLEKILERYVVKKMH